MVAGGARAGVSCPAPQTRQAEPYSLYLSYLHPEDTLMSNGRSSELLLRLPNQGTKLTE